MTEKVAASRIAVVAVTFQRGARLDIQLVRPLGVLGHALTTLVHGREHAADMAVPGVTPASERPASTVSTDLGLLRVHLAPLALLAFGLSGLLIDGAQIASLISLPRIEPLLVIVPAIIALQFPKRG